MLDDHRGKAVAAIGDFSHRASLPLPLASELSGYPDNAFHLYPGQQLKPGEPLHWTGRDQTWN